MNFFKKMIAEEKEYNDIISSVKSTFEPKPVDISKPEEEWVWVEGYKGTDKDMKCRDFQYELGTQYDISNSREVAECKNGFHLCLTLHDVFNYYCVGDGNRFFRVKALVRKSDKDKYGTYETYEDSWGCTHTLCENDKLAAKSIIFKSELTIDEVLKNTEVQTLSEQYKQLAIETSVQCAVNNYNIDTLIEDGYSQPFADYIVSRKLFDIAHAVGSQKDLSMDMKVLAILNKK